MNLTDPDPDVIPHDLWDAYDAMITLKRANKWLSAAALVGILIIMVLAFDLTDERPEWAQ